MTTTFTRPANNSYGILGTALTPGAVTMILSSGNLPAAYPFLCSIDSEILKVTAGPDDYTYTVERAQEGTTAAAHISGSVVEIRPTAGEYNAHSDAINALESATEIRLTPKASSTGAEGTIFYNSGDDHVYVGTE